MLLTPAAVSSLENLNLPRRARTLATLRFPQSATKYTLIPDGFAFSTNSVQLNCALTEVQQVVHNQPQRNTPASVGHFITSKVGLMYGCCVFKLDGSTDGRRVILLGVQAVYYRSSTRVAVCHPFRTKCMVKQVAGELLPFGMISMSILLRSLEGAAHSTLYY